MHVTMVMVVMTMSMIMGMSVVVIVIVIVAMRVGQMHIELHAVDAGLLFALNMQVITVELEFLQLAFEFVRIHAKVEQRGNEHVTGDAAENIEVKRFHGECSSKRLDNWD